MVNRRRDLEGRARQRDVGRPGSGRAIGSVAWWNRVNRVGGFRMKMFELENVVSLLRDEVRRVGGQTAFAKKPAFSELN